MSRCEPMGVISRDSFLNRRKRKTKAPKPAKTYINRKLKQCVWERYFGDNYRMPCYCCNLSDITPFTFQCGHVQAESRGGATNIRNLRPICQLCNLAAGDNLMTFFARQNGFDDSLLLKEEVVIYPQSISAPCS